MFHPICTKFGMGGVLLSVALANFATFEVEASVSIASQARSIAEFTQANPNTSFYESGERITHVYGKSFSHGESAFESAEAFRLNQAAMFGVNAEDIVFTTNPQQPIGYLPEIDDYKFTGFNYYQQEQGIEVFRSRMVLLVRNEAGFPLVLASVDLRDLGGFKIDNNLLGKALGGKTTQAVLNQVQVLSELAGDALIASTRQVIWAGVDDMVVQPRLAIESSVSLDVDEWLILTDAQTGEILFEDQLICFLGGTSGNVSGRATEGIGAEQCENEVPMPFPWLKVTSGANTATTDANGDYSLANADATVTATLNGTWFDVINAQGAETTETESSTPPTNFLFNAANSSEVVRAQVNAYVEANRVRDAAIAANPTYPTLNNNNFPVTTNIVGGICPGNAWYSIQGQNINFCLAGGQFPNTAWSSVVHHEYGHHLVAAGGSGQGQYGEGMGDVMSLVILDSNFLGWGIFGDCNTSWRNADNNLQYPCNGLIQFCGQLISGCVWETRNELIITEPDNYLQILGFLAVNAILVHCGTDITPQITIDWLTLDDDDDDIANGTPHYNEIAIGFGEHNMDAPPLILLKFTFPDGLPELVLPSGGTTVRVEVAASSEQPVPGTGMLHVNTGGGFVEIPMDIVSPNVYDAVFPVSVCLSNVVYFFSAQTTDNNEVIAPGIGSFSALSGAVIITTFEDDFESNLGWTVSNAVSDGQWGRGIPVDCNRGDPPTDADGSGQCYLTDNSAADGCNSDVDNGSTTLTSPILDASDVGSVISYWRWYSNTFGKTPMQDIFTVEVSSNNGASWVTLETVGPGGLEVDGGWFRKDFIVSDFVELTDQFRIRFIASDIDPQSVVEAGVDLVRMRQIFCDAGVPGDLNGDGVVNTVDLLILFANWGQCADCNNCPADLDGNCTVGTSDLLLLFSNWG